MEADLASLLTEGLGHWQVADAFALSVRVTVVEGHWALSGPADIQIYRYYIYLDTRLSFSNPLPQGGQEYKHS